LPIEHAASRPLALTLRPQPVATVLLGVVLGGGVAAADGGYFPEQWAWLAALTFIPAAIVLIAGGGARLGRLDLTFLGLLIAFGCWTLLSAAWSPSTTSSVLSAQRILAYLGVLLLVLLVVEKRTAPLLLGGCLAGVTLISGYALLTRLLPGSLASFDTLSGYRLSDPVGYWNGLGVYAAMGILLAVGFLARAERTAARVAAAALPVVLATTLYFTFSRGSWLALAAGLAVAVVFDPARLRLLVAALAVAPWCAVAVWAASRCDALTTRGATLADARSQGQTLLLALAALSLASGAAGLAVTLADRRLQIGARTRYAFVGVLVAAAFAGIGAVWVHDGSPVSLARSAWSQFRGPPAGSSADLNSRLFTLSSNGRTLHWRVAWDDFTAHPLVGEGAGTYAASWAKRRPQAFTVQNAHSLYLETLGELGLVGLALLAGFLFVPAVAAARVRRAIVFPGGVAAMAAYLVHAAGDWDWQLTGVTIVALLAGSSLLASARADAASENLRRRHALLALAVAGTALALLSVLGNVPLGRSRDALAASRWAAAASAAHTAQRWMPWSSEPLRLLGEAYLGAGDVAGARASFRSGVRKDPVSWKLWLDLALASNDQERRVALEHAQTLNPLSPEVKELLAG
jgi:hypothetical protein